MASKGYWTPARRRAFAKMRAGLRRARGGSVKRRRRSTKTAYARRAGVVRMPVRRRRVRRNPMTALLANPSYGYTPAYAAGYSRTFAKSRRKRKASPMAKRRRRRRKASSTTRRRRRRAAPRRRIRRAKRVPRSRAHRYYKSRRGRVYLNPRRRRRRFSRRRRNPGGRGIMGAVKFALAPYLTGVAVAGASAMLDTMMASMPAVRQIAKGALAVGIAAVVGRKNPRMAAAAIGALGASQGYPLVTKLAGGLVARNPAEAVQGLGEMTETYPEMGALLQGGLGALLSGIPDVGDQVVNYEQALHNMAGDDDDE